MDKKGQLFSLDFLFSVIIVVFSLGTLMNAVEVKSFAEMQDAKAYKLRAVGDLASDLLVTNTAHTCRLISFDNDPSTNKPRPMGYLPNCIYKSGSSNASLKMPLKEDLGLDSTIYDCAMYINGERINPGGSDICNNSEAAISGKDVYSVRRLVVILKQQDGEINNVDLSACMAGSLPCKLENAVVLLKVWEK